MMSVRWKQMLRKVWLPPHRSQHDESLQRFDCLALLKRELASFVFGHKSTIVIGEVQVPLCIYATSGRNVVFVVVVGLTF
jgi:hypothetical protein